MYVRSIKQKRKRTKPKRYYYIVSSKREGDKVKQKIIMFLGTVENIFTNYKIARKYIKKHKQD
jgi:hypothetical protein